MSIVARVLVILFGIIKLVKCDNPEFIGKSSMRYFLGLNDFSRLNHYNKESTRRPSYKQQLFVDDDDGEETTVYTLRSKTKQTKAGPERVFPVAVWPSQELRDRDTDYVNGFPNDEIVNISVFLLTAIFQPGMQTHNLADKVIVSVATPKPLIDNDRTVLPNITFYIHSNKQAEMKEQPDTIDAQPFTLSLRRAMDGKEDGYADDDQFYADNENPNSPDTRKGGGNSGSGRSRGLPSYGEGPPPDYKESDMPSKGPNSEGQAVDYTVDEPVLRSRPDGRSGRPPGYGGPGRPPGYRGPGGPPPGFGGPGGPPPGYGGPGGPPPGYRGPPPGYGGRPPVFRGPPPGYEDPVGPPPGYGRSGAPPGFGPPGPRSQAYMGVGARGGPDPRALLPSGSGQDEIQYSINHDVPQIPPEVRQNAWVPTGEQLVGLTRHKLELYKKVDEKYKQGNNSKIYTTMPPLDLKSQLKALPRFDDFGAPVKWVKFNSHETVDGLAKVTDPSNMRNRQYTMEGAIYVPVADRNPLRSGPMAEETTTQAAPVQSTPYPNYETIQTVLRNVVVNRTNEMDWLAVEAVSLNVKGAAIKECTGDGCQSRCRTMNCDSACSGDSCGSGCIGVSCNAFCRGPGCVTMCIGEYCTTKCDGENCHARCWGKSCEASCRRRACQQSRNGAYIKTVPYWEQNQQDEYGAPGPGYGGRPNWPQGPGGPGGPGSRSDDYDPYGQ